MTYWSIGVDDLSALFLRQLRRIFVSLRARPHLQHLYQNKGVAHWQQVTVYARARLISSALIAHYTYTEKKKSMTHRYHQKCAEGP